MRSRLLVAVLASVALALPSAVATADGHVSEVVSFDPSAGEFAEGIAVDKTGNIYVSMTFLDQIHRIAPGGTRSVFARLDPGTAPAGLVATPSGDLFVAAGGFDLSTGSTDPALRGVYRIGSDGSMARLPGTGAMIFPNDVILDERGNLYATDTVDGAVWRIPRGGEAELWSADPAYVGDGSFGFGIPIGANGVAVRGRELLVGNPERGLLLAVPILPDGTAGEVDIASSAPELLGVDGIAVDLMGNVYAATVQNLLIRVGADGSVETLANADDGLNQPSTVAFGTTGGDQKTLFVLNFSVFVPNPTPGILAVRIGVPGAPVP